MLKHIIAAALFMGTPLFVLTATAGENTTSLPAAERMATFVACMEARTAGTPAVAVTPFVKGVEFDARIVGARLDTRFAYRADTAKFARYNACRRAAGELAVAAN
jgi:hypothetical protein